MRRSILAAAVLAVTTAASAVPAVAAQSTPTAARPSVTCTTAQQLRTCTTAPVRLKRTVTKDARGRTVVTTITRYTQTVTMATRVTTRVFTTTTRVVGRSKPVTTTTKRVTVTPITSETPTPTTPTPTTPTPTAPSPQPTAATRGAVFESEIVRLVNVERAKAGLSPMTRDARIDAVARAWSQTMARTGKFEHRPDWAWADSINRYSGAAENIAWGYPSAAEMMKGWMNSPGHRSNIMSPRFRYIGVGVAFSSSGRPYGTQNFMTDVNADPGGPTP